MHFLISRITKDLYIQSLGSDPQIGRNYQTVSSKQHSSILFIFHHNARSVRNKLSYVEDIASESSKICVTESHLDTNIVDNDIIIDGFSDQILRKDRNCFGGQ